MFDCDDDTALKAFEAIERWNEDGDCAELQECSKHISECKSES